MNYITVALAKGRMADLAVSLFEKIGVKRDLLRNNGRKLIFVDEENKLKFILVKAADVPVYVEHGVADCGVVGKDVLLEEGRELYELFDLGYGKCKICVASVKNCDRDAVFNKPLLKVASKYTNISKQFFSERGQNIEIIKLNGSIELAPIVGLSDVIVDIVESGRTLQENGLSVIHEICDSSGRFVVNRVSMKLECARITDITSRLKEAVSLV